MKKIIKYVGILIALCPLAYSCIGLDTAPYDRETDLTYWSQDPDAALKGLNTCYQFLPGMNDLVTMEAATDNAYYKGGVSTGPIAAGKYDADYGYIKSFWDGKYNGIHACNELLSNIDKVPSLSKELKARYSAECKTLRAYLYYELYTKFGSVPYFTNVISVADSRTIGRTDRAKVVANVISELEEAISSNALPATYEGADRGRITIGAAKALLAKVYLFEGNFEKVRDLTGEIMESGTYSLFGNYSELFEPENEYNSEVILDSQFAPVLREWSLRDCSLVPPSMGGYAGMGPLQELVDSYIMLNGKGINEAGSGYDKNNPYDNRDPRLKATIIYTGNSYPMADGTENVIDCQSGRDGYGTTSDVTPTGYYVRKWWDKNYRQSLLTGTNPIIIRYADILLMNAEAHAELGSFNESVWNKTIKLIRQRAGFTSDAALNFNASADNKALIRNERRCELAFEGLRHKDIMRWKLAEKVLNGNCHGLYTGDIVGTDNGYVILEKRAFDPAKHYLWPIPQKDRDMNKNLDQNPNW